MGLLRLNSSDRKTTKNALLEDTFDIYAFNLVWTRGS